MSGPLLPEVLPTSSAAKGRVFRNTAFTWTFYASNLSTGCLFVVATPIGNLEDITYRAVRVLKEADAIACEDTRHTRKLLDHYGIDRPLLSYHEHNEAERTAQLLERLRDGRSIALVSDAGTPLISDPGYRVISAAAKEGIRIIPVPGPSAAIAALSASGLPTDAFRFCGFVPAKAGQRLRLFEALVDETATLIFYEAPHRILETLEAMRAPFRTRPVVIGRELTKMHEELLRGTIESVAAELAARPAVKGELTILIGAGERSAAEFTEPVRDAVKRFEAEGIPRMEAMKRVARERGLSKRDVYRELEIEARE